MNQTIDILDFCKKNYSHIHEDVMEEIKGISELSSLIDAPAWMPFCKYISLAPRSGFENSTLAEITPANIAILKSGYEKRYNESADELEYLTRWFVKGTVDPLPCKSLTVILYNKEQLQKEGISINADYGMVAINIEPTFEISPMTPATIERNALGLEFGGNGCSIDRNYYKKAVEFWAKYAIIIET